MDPVSILSTTISVLDRFTARGDGGVGAMLSAMVSYQKASLDLLIAVSVQISEIRDGLNDLQNEIPLKLELATVKQYLDEVVSIVGELADKLGKRDCVSEDERKEYDKDFAGTLLNRVNAVAYKLFNKPYYEAAIAYGLLLPAHISLLYHSPEPGQVPSILKRYLDWADHILDPSLDQSVASNALSEAKKANEVSKALQASAESLLVRGVNWLGEFKSHTHTVKTPPNDPDMWHDETVTPEPQLFRAPKAVKLTADISLEMRVFNTEQKDTVRQWVVKSFREQSIPVDDTTVLLPDLRGRRGWLVDDSMAEELTYDWLSEITSRDDWKKEAEAKKTDLQGQIAQINLRNYKAALFSRLATTVQQARNHAASTRAALLE